MEVRFFWKVALLILLTSICCSEAKKKKAPNPQYYLMNFCNWTFNMHDRHLDEALFGLTSSGVHGTDIDCPMPVVTSPGRQLSFKVLDMSLQDCHDSVTFYNGNSTAHSDAVSPKLCSKTADSYKTADSDGVVRFKATGHTANFLILITSFYTPEEKCLSGDFSCGNGQCIREKLFCNERDNCGDNSDEPKKCGKDDKWWLPIPCVAGGFSLLVLLCFIKSKNDKKKARIAAEKKKAEEAKKNAAEAKKKADERKKAEEKKKADEKKKAEEKKKEKEKKKEEEKRKAETEQNRESAPSSQNGATAAMSGEVIQSPVQEGNLLRLEPELESAPAPMMGAWEHPAPTPWSDGQKSEKQQLESSFELWTSSVPQTIPSMNSALFRPTMLPPPYTELPMTNLPNMFSEQQVTPDPPPVTFVAPMEPARRDESRNSGSMATRPRST